MYQYHVSFSPAQRTLSGVRRSLGEWARQCGFADPEVADIVYAAGEAFENAMEHGRDDFFVVEGMCSESALTIRIHDNGPGFEASGKGRLPPPEQLGNRGLGVFLMRALMDEARFEPRGDGGTTVTLTKSCRRAA